MNLVMKYEWQTVIGQFNSDHPRITKVDNSDYPIQITPNSDPPNPDPWTIQIPPIWTLQTQTLPIQTLPTQTPGQLDLWIVQTPGQFRLPLNSELYWLRTL